MLKSIENLILSDPDAYGLSLRAEGFEEPFAAVDVWGERHVQTQLLAYDRDLADLFVSIRYDDAGRIKEIFIPDELKDRVRHNSDGPSPWMLHRDGK
jgi:hypothetical protein